MILPVQPYFSFVSNLVGLGFSFLRDFKGSIFILLKFKPLDPHTPKD